MVTNNRIIDGIIHVGILVFWLGAIWSLLLAPSLVRHFYTERSISILAWPSVFTADFLDEFEKATQIKVRVTYFEHNEELLVKMQSGAAKGYDLVMPADYVVSLLAKKGLLKKIDKSRLLFWPGIQQSLLNQPFDPENNYTIPYAWSVYGIVVDTDKVHLAPSDYHWRLVFDAANHEYYVGMIDDAREIASLAAFYLFNTRPRDLTHQQWNELKKLLRSQKSRVAMYTDMRADYLLFSGVCPIAVTNSSEISRVVAGNDRFMFFVPEQGSFWVIDSFALPVTTKKEDLVYEFLNYLYQPEVMGLYAKRLGFSPAIALDNNESALYSSVEKLSINQRQFFDDAVPEVQLSDLWINLKS